MKSLIIFSLFLLPLPAFTQSVLIDLRIEKLSPFITSYSKTEIEKLMQDSIVVALNRGYVERTEKERRITFDSNDFYDYVIELRINDTVDIQAPERYKLVRLITIQSTVYEKGLKTELMSNPSSFAVGYSDYSGNLQERQTEDDVIKMYCGWTDTELTTSCLSRIPYFNSYSLTDFNVSEKEAGSFNSFRELLVIKTNFDKYDKDGVINRLVNDALLREQDFYFGVRSNTENYINIYDSVDATFTDYPLKIELVLNRKADCYTIQLVIDKSILTQHRTFHVPMQVEFSDDQLKLTQSRVLNELNDMIKKLLRLNLD